MKTTNEIGIGQEVVIVPAKTASEDFRGTIARQGRIVAEVVGKSNIGVCQIILPNGVSVPGYSHLVTAGPYKGRRFMDIHESHLALA